MLFNKRSFLYPSKYEYGARTLFCTPSRVIPYDLGGGSVGIVAFGNANRKVVPYHAVTAYKKIHSYLTSKPDEGERSVSLLGRCAPKE